ncbi:MAG: DUF6542 domain-containing protein [Actinophytocola sp.]|uniref:DUF6542 domain-containing protein n=1 Tax=Actinophytocola sp. TaxID=1872138 RepID=UPI003C771F73
MTATRDRRSDPEEDAGPAWDDRPIIGQFRGLPWWAAVLLAFGLTAIAAFVDMQQQDNTLGKIYQGAFVAGCVGAVCFVRRRSLFGPMVQPPLIFAITAVGAVALLSQKPSGGGLKSLILSVALPLTSNFPTMGITTAVVVLIGLFRWWRERDPDPEMRPNKPPRQRGADLGLDDEPGQGTGGRGRERSGKDRAAVPPRRGRPEMEELPPTDDRPARRVPGRAPRPSREPAAGREDAREAGREPRRRDPGAGRAERGRGEPPADAPGRGRGRGSEPTPRRREPGADGGKSRDERGRRDTSRDGGREGREGGRGGGQSRQPRRRPPEDR